MLAYLHLREYVCRLQGAAGSIHDSKLRGNLF